MARHFVFGKRGLACAAIALLAAAATEALSTSSIFHSYALKAQDLQFQWRGSLPVPDVVLLAVDQKSLDEISELLAFWHKYYAEAIRAAAAGGAKVIGLDVSFLVPVENRAPGYDQTLAAAVIETSQNPSRPVPVICAYIPSQMTKQQARSVPLNMLAAAMNLDGFVNLTDDPDDFIRRQELFSPSSGEDPDAHSFSLRVVESFWGAHARVNRSRLTIGAHRLPTSRDRDIRINFLGPAGTVPRVSFIDVLSAARSGNLAQLQRWVNGKIVLIGMDNVEDRYATPFFPLVGIGKWNTAGVEIHASTIETILTGKFLIPAPERYTIPALILLSLVTAILTLNLRLGAAIAANVLLTVVALAATSLAFRQGIVLPTLQFPTTLGFAVLLSSGWRFLTAEQKGRVFRGALEVFVAKQVAKSLDESEEISMSGTRQTVTILFSDIRGFTAFCDGQEPDTVVKLLNHYFTRMVAIIHEEGGQVNKFIGDGILAIFSEDDGKNLQDHAVRAVRCAARMIATDEAPFHTGAGIHSGPVVIGNIGSKEKLEYTALGDTVNLASRLETLNKDHHTALLMSEATCQRLGGSIETTLVASAAVRGKAKSVDLYTVTTLLANQAPAGSAA